MINICIPYANMESSNFPLFFTANYTNLQKKDFYTFDIVINYVLLMILM